VSQTTCWSLSESFSTIGSSVASFCAKKPLVTTAVSFVAGSCVTAGIIWLGAKLKKKKKEQENVSNYDLLCAVHFVAQQMQEVRDRLRLNITLSNSDE